jgi:hypothetical protein
LDTSRSVSVHNFFVQDLIQAPQTLESGTSSLTQEAGIFAGASVDQLATVAASIRQAMVSTLSRIEENLRDEITRSVCASLDTSSQNRDIQFAIGSTLEIDPELTLQLNKTILANLEKTVQQAQVASTQSTVSCTPNTRRKLLAFSHKRRLTDSTDCLSQSFFTVKFNVQVISAPAKGGIGTSVAKLLNDAIASQSNNVTSNTTCSDEQLTTDYETQFVLYRSPSPPAPFSPPQTTQDRFPFLALSAAFFSVASVSCFCICIFRGWIVVSSRRRRKGDQDDELRT